MKVSIGELPRLARILYETLIAYPHEGAAVILLRGDLGAGKTTFTAQLARVCGVADVVQSPTFVVMKRYLLPESSDTLFKQFIHIDAYRIEAEEESRVLGIKQMLQKEKTITCIEWPDHIANCLPDDVIELSLAHDADGLENIRHIDIHWKKYPDFEAIIIKKMQ